MVESPTEYEIFLKEIDAHGIILHVIPDSFYVHPIISNVILLLIKDVNTNKTYQFSFGHPDIIPFISKEKLTSDLNNLKNQKWTFDKKSFIRYFPIDNVNDINLLVFLYENKLIEEPTYQTAAHKFLKLITKEEKMVNSSIPSMKHQECFDNMCKVFLSLISNCKKDEGYIKENSIIIETLSKLEANGIYVDKDKFKSYYSADVYENNMVYSEYNIFTSTGRPSNRFQNVNYAALNKENGVRECFISRFGKDGKMVLVDYSAFHPRIICYLTKFELPVDIDIYEYLGKLYFHSEQLTEYDIDEAKKLTFRQLYGGIEEKYSNIKYLSNLDNFIKSHWKTFTEKGHILTPFFKRVLSNKHVLDANPNKLFNYILQATETELVLSSLKQINEYLSNKQTKSVLYTYDSILFDFYKGDGKETLTDIIDIMKMGNRFPIKVYIGDSYNSVNQVYP